MAHGGGGSDSHAHGHGHAHASPHDGRRSDDAHGHKDRAHAGAGDTVHGHHHPHASPHDGRRSDDAHGHGGRAHAGAGHVGHDRPHSHVRPDEAPRIHRARAPRPVRCAVIVASDARSEETDLCGRHLAETLAARGHAVAHRALVREEVAQVQAAIAAAAEAGAEVVLVAGGAGFSTCDAIVEAVEALLVRRLPGFGELFRMLAFQEIGSAAMRSRATAGFTADGRILFALPGSAGACRIALERLILPELGHLVAEVSR